MFLEGWSYLDAINMQLVHICFFLEMINVGSILFINISKQKLGEINGLHKEP